MFLPRAETLSELLLLVHQVWMDTTSSHTITNIINIGAMNAKNVSEVTKSYFYPVTVGHWKDNLVPNLRSHFLHTSLKFHNVCIFTAAV